MMNQNDGSVYSTEEVAFPLFNIPPPMIIPNITSYLNLPPPNMINPQLVPFYYSFLQINKIETPYLIKKLCEEKELSVSKEVESKPKNDSESCSGFYDADGCWFPCVCMIKDSSQNEVSKSFSSLSINPPMYPRSTNTSISLPPFSGKYIHPFGSELPPNPYSPYPDVCDCLACQMDVECDCDLEDSLDTLQAKLQLHAMSLHDGLILPIVELHIDALYATIRGKEDMKTAPTLLTMVPSYRSP